MAEISRKDKDASRGARKHHDFFDEPHLTFEPVSGVENSSIIPKSLQKKRMLEMFGLDHVYDMITETEKKDLLITPERTMAFENIDTSTNPRMAKIKQKKGIVSEILKRKLIPDNILKTKDLLYLGSGTDIEYPLAIGARKITMVDYLFGAEECVKDVLERIKKLTGEEPFLTGDSLSFQFDFGEGKEQVTVVLSSAGFKDPNKHGEVFTPKDEIGTILMFAPNHPGGTIKLEEEILSKVVPSGVVLVGDFLQNKLSGGWENMRLGKKRTEF
jgi:hypothetical protein